MGFGPMYVTLRGLCVKPLHQQAKEEDLTIYKLNDVVLYYG